MVSIVDGCHDRSLPRGRAGLQLGVSWNAGSDSPAPSWSPAHPRVEKPARSKALNAGMSRAVAKKLWGLH